MPEQSVEEVGERFDALYTRLTQLQRRLIAASRNGADDRAALELAREAAAIVRAVEIAGRATSTVSLSAREIEAEALRARVLLAPIEGVLVMAAARSQARAYAYPLLAEVITRADAQAAWCEWSVHDVLGAPQRTGEATAQRLARRLDLAPEALLGDLAEADRTRLTDALEEWAAGIPPEASGRLVKPKPPDDGRGAGEVVLERWIDAMGAGSSPVRLAAREATARSGWPQDAVAVAGLLLEFLTARVMPLLIPSFEAIRAAEPDEEGLISALRAEERSFRDGWHYSSDESEKELFFNRRWVLRLYLEALQAVRKARAQLAQSPDQRRGPSPLALARTAGLRCGTILGHCEPSPAPLLDELPGAHASEPPRREQKVGTDG